MSDDKLKAFNAISNMVFISGAPSSSYLFFNIITNAAYHGTRIHNIALYVICIQAGVCIHRV